jgi:hypothetical protein
VWGALQIRGVTGGREGVVVGLTLFPSGRQRVTGRWIEDPAVFCRKTPADFDAEAYRKRTGVSVSGKSAAKASVVRGPHLSIPTTHQLLIACLRAFDLFPSHQWHVGKISLLEVGVDPLKCESIGLVYRWNDGEVYRKSTGVSVLPIYVWCSDRGRQTHLQGDGKSLQGCVAIVTFVGGHPMHREPCNARYGAEGHLPRKSLLDQNFRCYRRRAAAPNRWGHAYQLLEGSTEGRLRFVSNLFSDRCNVRARVTENPRRDLHSPLG